MGHVYLGKVRESGRPALKIAHSHRAPFSVEEQMVPIAPVCLTYHEDMSRQHRQVETWIEHDRRALCRPGEAEVPASVASKICRLEHSFGRTCIGMYRIRLDTFFVFVGEKLMLSGHLRPSQGGYTRLPGGRYIRCKVL